MKRIMEGEIFKIAASQGIWAALSVALIFYILKAQEKRDVRQEEREKNYQGIISKLTEKLNIVEEVKQDVEDIKEKVVNIKIRLNELGLFSFKFEGTVSQNARYFSYGLKSAIETFQLENYLDIDGAVGPQTWCILFGHKLSDAGKAFIDNYEGAYLYDRYNSEGEREHKIYTLKDEDTPTVGYGYKFPTKEVENGCCTAPYLIVLKIYSSFNI